MTRTEWISNRAYHLWEKANRPEGRDLDFWLAAERDHDLCVLSPGNCPFQDTQPTTGGKHVSRCTLHNPPCKYNGVHFTDE